MIEDYLMRVYTSIFSPSLTLSLLSSLGLDHLVGTNLLRAYMHGYFVDLRLYEKARSILNPFDFEDFKKSQVDAKMQKERESRISVSAKNRPKINRALADKLIQGENALTAVEDSKKNKKSKSLTSGQGTASNPLGDSRFADLFKDSEFEIDMESREYKLHHPTEVSARLCAEGEVGATEFFITLCFFTISLPRSRRYWIALMH